MDLTVEVTSTRKNIAASGIFFSLNIVIKRMAIIGGIYMIYNHKLRHSKKSIVVPKVILKKKKGFRTK